SWENVSPQTTRTGLAKAVDPSPSTVATTAVAGTKMRRVHLLFATLLVLLGVAWSFLGSSARCAPTYLVVPNMSVSSDVGNAAELPSDTASVLPSHHWM